MKEFKARQYIQGDFYYFGWLGDDTFTSPQSTLIDKYPIEMYICKKDINDNDIYEGHIVRCKGYMDLLSVKYHTDESYSGFSLFDNQVCVFDNFNNVEIVGDVHNGVYEELK